LVRTTGTERKQVATTIRHRGSAVLGETVTIASGATAGVQGSAVKAEQALRIQAKDVEIESVADSHTHTDKTRAVNGEVRVGQEGPNGCWGSRIQRLSEGIFGRW